MNTEHPRFYDCRVRMNGMLFSEHGETEHIELNHYIEQWTTLIDPSSINHLSAVIDKHINCRKLRKATMRRIHKNKAKQR